MRKKWTMRYWYLSANRSEAVIYKSVNFKAGKARFVARFLNPAGKKHERDLDSDRPGMKISSSNRVVSLAEHFHKRREQIRKFAKMISKEMKAGLDQDRFDYFVIQAEPKLLGMIKEELDPRVLRHLKTQIPAPFATISKRAGI